MFFHQKTNFFEGFHFAWLMEWKTFSNEMTQNLTSFQSNAQFLLAS